jgi:hypothetical protein
MTLWPGPPEPPWDKGQGMTATESMAGAVPSQGRRRTWLTSGLGVALAALVFGVESGLAGGLGIPLDGFLTQWQAWVIGLGIILFITGLAGWAGEKFNTPYQPMLAGSMSLFTNAGLLGGGLVLAGLLGLTAGATLPL